MKIVTTSWDDGAKDSLKIADLLSTYDLAGTFYIPTNAIKGKSLEDVSHSGPFLDKSDLENLVCREYFELGAHGVTHRYLTSLSLEDVKEEVKKSKAILEDFTGQKIHGFAYPGGKYNKNIVKEIKKGGFSYARTTTDGKLNPTERFRLPVSIFCSNTFIGRTKFTILSPFSNIYAFGGDWVDSVLKGYKNLKEKGGVLHIAGHPQDMSEENFYRKIKKIFHEISGDHEVKYLTNSQMVNKLIK